MDFFLKRKRAEQAQGSETPMAAGTGREEAMALTDREADRSARDVRVANKDSRCTFGTLPWDMVMAGQLVFIPRVNPADIRRNSNADNMAKSAVLEVWRVSNILPTGPDRTYVDMMRVLVFRDGVLGNSVADTQRFQHRNSVMVPTASMERTLLEALRGFSGAEPVTGESSTHVEIGSGLGPPGSSAMGQQALPSGLTMQDLVTMDQYYTAKHAGGSPTATGDTTVDTATQAFWTMDGHKWTCRTKGAGGHRMIVNEGLFRLMRRERLEYIVHDMLLDAPGYLVYLKEFNADHLSRMRLPGMDESMDRLQRVWPLPIFRSASKLESFLLCKDWPRGDWGQWSLRDFQYEGDQYHEWGLLADQAGKMALWSNMQMCEATMEVVFDADMVGAMKAIECVTYRRCAMFADGFLRYHLEKLMARFFEDVLRNKKSMMFPEQAMDTPKGCADLLRLMCEEFAEATKAVPRDGVRAFEPYPHTNFFHPVTGAWSTVTNRHGTAFSAKADKRGAKGPCLYRLCGIADMKDSKGDTLKCKFGTRCGEEHPPSSATLTDFTSAVTADAWERWRATPDQRQLLKTTLGLGAEFLV